MTNKEKLYKEYVIAKNKVNTLRGEELIGGDNLEEYFNSRTFSYTAGNYKKDELKQMIRWANVAYETEVDKLRVEHYFNTAEGAAEKKSITDRIEALTEARRAQIKSCTENVDAFIKRWLGEDWGCNTVSWASVNIGLVEKVVDGNNSFYFGHSFNLYYSDYFMKERFEMNYGCMSSFKLLDDEEGNLRCKYLLGMATFANDKEKLNELKELLIEHTETLHNLEKEIDVLNYNLSHPFDKKEVA